MIERHAVVLTAYNQVEQQHNLTVQTVESILKQDIGPLDLLLIDNGSTVRGTWEHFEMLREMYTAEGSETRIHTKQFKENWSPVKIANCSMAYMWRLGHGKILGVSNDVILPANFYRLADEFPRGIICGSMTEQLDFPTFEKASAMNECTPMAVALVRKWAYDALVAKDGYFFDENFFLYASDCDFALRIAACGIRGVQLDVQYWHHGSAHWRLLDQEAGRRETSKADVDRAYFVSKWGFPVTAYEYGACAADINFRGKGKAVGA